MTESYNLVAEENRVKDPKQQYSLDLLRMVNRHLSPSRCQEVSWLQVHDGAFLILKTTFAHFYLYINSFHLVWFLAHSVASSST